MSNSSGSFSYRQGYENGVRDQRLREGKFYDDDDLEKAKEEGRQEMTPEKVRKLYARLSKDYVELSIGFNNLAKKYEEKMNTPGTSEYNWRNFQMLTNIYKNIAERIADISRIYKSFT